MPCYEPPGHPQDAQRITLLSRLLCEAVSLIPPAAFTAEASAGLRDWRVEHDKADSQERRRVDTEKNIQQSQRTAWDKLTPDERAAIGIRYRP